MKKSQPAPNPVLDILPDTGAGYRHGQVLFANDSRFLDTHFSEPLTNYAVGWRDPSNNEAFLDFMAPPVQVGRRFEWKKANNAEEFLSETEDDIRAIGADFPRVRYNGTDVTDKTLNKGLTYVADLDNVAGNWREQKTAKLLRRLIRNEVRRTFALLDAAAVSGNKTWGSSADPDQDVASELITAGDLIGINPNRVLYGAGAWNLRRTAYRAQDKAGAFANSGMTPEQVAAYLGVEQVLVSNGRYQSTASAKAQVVGLKVHMFYAEAGADEEDGSHVKRFWSPVEGGGMYRVYEQQLSSKLVAITVEHYSKAVVTFPTGIRRFVVS